MPSENTRDVHCVRLYLLKWNHTVQGPIRCLRVFWATRVSTAECHDREVELPAAVAAATRYAQTQSSDFHIVTGVN